MADLTDVLPKNWMNKKTKPLHDQIIDAFNNAGIVPPDHIEIDDEIHRFKTTGKDKSGWYVFYSDDPVAGAFGDWKEGVELNFCAEVDRELTEEERSLQRLKIERAKAAREEERLKQYKEVAKDVDRIWNAASPAQAENPYLLRKQIKPHGARISGDLRLIVPILDKDGKLTSLQYIDANGGKMYQKGGQIKGCYWYIGNPDSSDEIFIAEGFATASSIHESTGKPCIVAYSASNIVPVAQNIRSLYKTAKITIMADHDAGGVGRSYADQAASIIGASVYMPQKPGQDFNDYVNEGNSISDLLTPSRHYLIDANEFLTDFKPISWLIKGVIPKSSSIMLFGPSGAGKSFLLIDWMMHIATGKDDWHGHKVKPGLVVYLAGEGHQGIKGRLKAWIQEHGADEINMHISKSSCDLNTPEGIQNVLNELRSLPEEPALIVIDTLNRFLDGDENSAKDVRQMMNSCDLIRQVYPNSSNLFCHHTGVSGEAQGRARGSSAWRASMEVELCITPKGGCIELSQKKAKDGKQMDEFYYLLDDVVLENVLDEDGEYVASAVVRKTEKPDDLNSGSKLDKQMHQFEKAWVCSGYELLDGKPYLARAAYIRYAVEKLEIKEGTAERHVKPSATSGLIYELSCAGVIEKQAQGWVLLDQVVASTWILRRGGAQ